MDPQAPNISETPAPSNNVTQQPNRSNNITVISMAIFILMSLGVVVFLYYQNQQLKQMLASYQAPAASPTPVATSDPTANWKTFTDIKTGLSFKYPQRLSLPAPQVAGSAIPNGEFVLTDSNSGSNHPFTVDTIKYNGNLDSFIGKYSYLDNVAKLEMTNLNTNSPLGDLVSKSDTMAIYKYVNHYDQTINPGAKDIINYKAMFVLDGYGFVVISSSTTDTLSEFNQILSTFKFISANPSVIPSIIPVSTSSALPKTY